MNLFVSSLMLVLLLLLCGSVSVKASANEDGCDCEQTCMDNLWEFEECSDDSDDPTCGECASEEFACGNSVCMNGPWECEERSDCLDGSSEPPVMYYCPGDVTIPVRSLSEQTTYSWDPPFPSNSAHYAIVTFVCLATASVVCNPAGDGHFSVGVTKVMYNATDMSGNDTICAFTVTVTAVDLVCPAKVTALASPGTKTTTLNWLEPDLVGWEQPTNFTSSDSPGDTFPVGTHRITYQQWFGINNLRLECSFTGVVKGQCSSGTTTDIAHGVLNWPVTITGTLGESVERCPLRTSNGINGSPKAVRNCSLMDPPVYFAWEDHISKSCGQIITNVSIEDVEQTPVTLGNAAEVAEYLANVTSASLDTEGDIPVNVITNILKNIVNASSGDSEVTQLVLEAVNNVVLNNAFNPDSSDDDVSSSAIVQSVQTQVSLTLQQEGSVSIKEDTVHVEAISRDPQQVSNGLTFASVWQDTGQGQTPQEGTLDGTEVKTFDNTNEIPSDSAILASIRLPGNIGDLLSSATGNSSSQLQASFIIYATDALFQSAHIRENQQKNGTKRVAGPVVSLTVENVVLTNLTEPVVVEFKAPDTEEVNGSIQCVFWDFGLEDEVGDWSTDGCALAGLTDERVSCNCNHATNFAIILDIKGQKPGRPKYRALDIISQVGCSLSIIALAFTLITYLSIRKLRTGKSRQIFIHFCVSLLLLYIVFLAGVDNAIHSVGGCVFVAALLHYLALTTMMWMAVEARNMYVSTVKVFPEDTPRYMVKACLIAWGAPVVVLVITLAAATEYYKNKYYCFISPGLAMYLGLLAPIGLILIHNIITFILVMRSLLKVTEASRSQQISKRLQNAIGISALMGLTWCFGFLAIDVATFTFQLIFCLANSLQGVIVCIMFCIRREEVRTAVASYLRRICCTCRLPSSHHAQTYDLTLATISSPTIPSSTVTSNIEMSVSELHCKDVSDPKPIHENVINKTP